MIGKGQDSSSANDSLYVKSNSRMRDSLERVEGTHHYTFEDLSKLEFQRGMRDSYADYLEYCNEDICDSVIQTGSINTKNTVPVYDNCGNITYYKEIPGDTIWNKVQCPEYIYEYFGFDKKSNRIVVYGGISLFCDTVSIWKGNNFNWRYKEKIRTCTIERKVECVSKREKSTPEGFYIWLFNEIKKGE